jgi:hypothetical protein
MLIELMEVPMAIWTSVLNPVAVFSAVNMIAVQRNEFPAALRTCSFYFPALPDA